MDFESNFPRGGYTTTGSSKNEIHGGKREKSNPRKRKQSDSETGDTMEIHRNICADTLSYAKIHENMLILGCVRKIMGLYLQIELPGRVFGYVDVSNLSRPYRDLLTESVLNKNMEEETVLETLNKLYFVGQILPTKVIEIEQENGKSKIKLSIDPFEINSDLSVSAFKKGMLIWAAVQSKMEHGFLLDVGHDNCRVFLPFEEVNKEQDLCIGQTLYGVISNSQISCNSAIIKVSILKEQVSTAMQSDFNTHLLIPGVQLDFQVTKILRNGLEGKLACGTIAYVNEMFLRKPLQNLKLYNIGTTYKARLMYVEALTKFIFLTFRKIDVVSLPEYAEGSVHPAEVISKTNGGIFFKLPNHEKELVTDKRLLTGAQKGVDFKKYLAQKFSVGTIHNTVILSYNPLEQIYIGSTEKDMIQEKNFHKYDLKVGDVVNVEILTILDKGLAVKVGHIKGFIQNLHLGNGEYSEAIKSKFRVNQRLKVRVWDNNERGVYFTNKKTLLNTDAYFTNYNYAVINKEYLGIVSCILPSGDLLVLFFGGNRGILQNPDITYFIGQVIRTKVVGKSAQGLILSLPEPEQQPKFLEIGDYTNAVLEQVVEHALIVTLPNSNIRAVVPETHLSSALSLNSLLLGSYKVGSNLQDLICIDIKEMPILSLREGQAYKNSNMTMFTFDELEVGSLLRGIYISHNKDVVRVLITLPPSCNAHNIPITNFSVPRGTPLTFKPDQPLMLLVKAIDRQTKKLELSGKLCDVYKKERSDVLNILESFLVNHTMLQKLPKELKHLKLGQKVLCEVTLVGKEGCVLSVNSSSLKGLAHRSVCPNKIVVGDKIEGIIIWMDLERKFVHVVLDEKLVSEISPVQDGETLKMSSLSRAKVLYLDENIIITVLMNAEANRQLTILPTFIHDNWFYGKMDGYKLLEEIRVVLHRKVGNLIIGLDKRYYRTINGYLKKREHRTKMRATSSTGITNTNTSSDCSNLISQQKPEASVINNLLSYRKTSPENYITREVHHSSSVNEFKNISDKEKKDSGLSDMSGFFSEETLIPKTNSSCDDGSSTEPPLKKQKRPVTEEPIGKRILRKRVFDGLTADPLNAEQFEKRLLGDPNNSKLWTKYCSFYLALSEIDKAKEVAKRALQTISLDEHTERYNIWITLLHLANGYENQAVFEEVFDEAVKCNEPLDIYLEAIKMLLESHKLDEANNKILKAKKKFRTDLRTWMSLAKIYYDNNMNEQARKCTDGAIRCTCVTKDQINVLMEFAILEFRFKNINEGEVLFEILLEKHPRAMQIWVKYIDQVVKVQDFVKARNLFARAIAQDTTLPRKKGIYMKYHDFELKYGTPNEVKEIEETITRLYGNKS